MREPSLERIADEIEALSAREGLNQHLIGFGNDGDFGLKAEPIGDLRRETRPGVFDSQQIAHAGGKISRERKLAAVIGRDLRLSGIGAGDDGVHLAQALEAEHFACEDEAVAWHELLDEPFLDLAENAARDENAFRLQLAAAAAREPHLQHRRLDDGADIQTILPCEPRMAQTKLAVRGWLQLGVAIVARKRIAAGRDKLYNLIKDVAS